MFRRACLPRVLFFVFLLRLCAFTQQSPTPANSLAATDSDKQAATARQAAMSMLEEVLAATGALALPQNRLAIELEAFPIISARSQPRARALINQMVSEFSQAASHSDSNLEFSLSNLRQERTRITSTLAQTDAELALQFLTATLPYVQSTSAKDDGPDDHDLLLGLAAQIAAHDPHRALQMAERQLQSDDGLSTSLIALLEEVQQHDAQSGAQLFHDMVQRVKQADLVGEGQSLSFASSLLSSQFTRQSEKGGAPDDSLRSLAEAIITAVSSPIYQQSQNWALSDGWPALNALVPARVAALHRREAANVQAISSEEKLQHDFNDARSNGDSDTMVRLIAIAPDDERTSMAARAVWHLANNGDLERTRQVAANLNPWQANNAIQEALRNAASAAGEHGDFATARHLAAQITDEDGRAILLSQLSLHANHAGKRRMAEEILGEAASLLLNHAAGTSAFSAQLAVAQAYLRVNPAQAVPLLECAAGQIEQALAAAAQLDGFLPDQHSFEGSELVLSRGFLYQSLIQPYAVATADLATIDLPAARTLADRLPLPEARLMTELFVARGVLDAQDVQTSKNQAAPSRHAVLLFSERFR